MRYVRSTKDAVRAVVQGPSPNGEQYRSIEYKHGATEVVHYHAAVKRLTAVPATSPPPPPTETQQRCCPPRVYGSCSPLCNPSFSHVFCTLRTLRIQLFHWWGTRPHDTDPLPPQWQHMLWLWTTKPAPKPAPSGVHPFGGGGVTWRQSPPGWGEPLYTRGGWIWAGGGTCEQSQMSYKVEEP